MCAAIVCKLETVTTSFAFVKCNCFVSNALRALCPSYDGAVAHVSLELVFEFECNKLDFHHLSKETTENDSAK